MLCTMSQETSLSQTDRSVSCAPNTLTASKGTL